MGAETFMNSGSGKTVAEAFRTAVEQAQYDHGHAGYTGSLAEKSDYVEIAIPSDFMPTEEPKKRARGYADKLINDSDGRIDDKWGPAGVIVVSKEKGKVTILIFGWASS